MSDDNKPVEDAAVTPDRRAKWRAATEASRERARVRAAQSPQHGESDGVPPPAVDAEERARRREARRAEREALKARRAGFASRRRNERK